jgi:hypothetical protein
MNELIVWVIESDGKYTHFKKSAYTMDLNKAALFESRKEALAYRTSPGERVTKLILVPKKVTIEKKRRTKK